MTMTTPASLARQDLLLCYQWRGGIGFGRLTLTLECQLWVADCQIGQHNCPESNSVSVAKLLETDFSDGNINAIKHNIARKYKCCQA